MAGASLTPEEKDKLKAVKAANERDDLYAVLGIPRTSEKAGVEDAYRDYVRKWHPDRFYSRDAGEFAEDIQANFVHVSRAHKTLRDDLKRAAYEAEFLAKGGRFEEVVAEKPGHEVTITRQNGALRPDGAPKPMAAPAPAAAPPPPRRRGRDLPPGMGKVFEQLQDQVRQARRHFEQGMEEVKAGQYLKAESSFYLAMCRDPRNEEYKRAYEEVVAKSRALRAQQAVAQAKQAEQYGNIRDAMASYRKAVEADPEDGFPFYRLAVLVRSEDQDDREAMNLLRKAILKDPRKVDYHVLLAQILLDLDLVVNAKREVQTAVELDPTNDAVKALVTRIKGRR